MQEQTLASNTVMSNVSGTLLELYEVIDNTISKLDNGESKRHDLAVMLVMSIAETFGGQAFYLPKGATTKRWLRNHRIFEDWKGGMTHNDLIKKYKLSSPVVYSIITKMRAMPT